MSKSHARERWAGLISDQSSSGLKVAEWCREHNIDKASFYSWRKRLSSADVPLSDKPQFVRLSINPLQQSRSSHLLLHIGSVSVSVYAGFDSHLLSEVLDVLESRGC